MKTKTYNVEMADGSIIKVKVVIAEIEKYGLQAVQKAASMSDKAIDLVLAGYAETGYYTIKAIEEKGEWVTEL